MSIVDRDGPGCKAKGSNGRFRPLGDERLSSFVEWLNALDEADARALTRAQRELRHRHRISVCLVSTTGPSLPADEEGGQG